MNAEQVRQELRGLLAGADAPASIWHVRFAHASLGHARQFGILAPSSGLWSLGNGQAVAQPKAGSRRGRSGTR